MVTLVPTARAGTLSVKKVVSQGLFSATTTDSVTDLEPTVNDERAATGMNPDTDPSVRRYQWLSQAIALLKTNVKKSHCAHYRSQPVSHSLAFAC